MTACFIANQLGVALVDVNAPQLDTPPDAMPKHAYDVIYCGAETSVGMAQLLAAAEHEERQARRERERAAPSNVCGGSGGDRYLN